MYRPLIMFTVALGLAHTASAACPAPYDTASCNSVCTYITADLWSCDVSAAGSASEVYVVEDYDATVAYEAWGDDGGTNFCCDSTGGTPTEIEIVGSDYDDKLAFVWNAFANRLKPASGTLLATIKGSYGADTIDGSDQNSGTYQESLHGEEQKDTIRGNAGSDVIDGGDDDDTCFGGDQNDYIYGRAGRDTINGQGHDDFIYGGADDDWLAGGIGVDYIWGEANSDTIMGNNGADFLYGGPGVDYISGGDNDDLLDGGTGGDVLCGDGEVGGDTLYDGDAVNDGDILWSANLLDSANCTAGTDTTWDWIAGLGTCNFGFGAVAARPLTCP